VKDLLRQLDIQIYNIHLLQIRKHRFKRNPGQGIRWSMFGNWAFAAAAVGMVGCAALFPERMLTADTVRTAGWIYLGGWVSFMILCYASKIVPFLWWTAKYGERAGQPGRPVMSDLLNEKRVFAGLALIAAASALFAAGIAADLPWLIKAGGTVYSVCSVIYAGMLGFVFAK
jgi:hypothetical protein